MEYCKFGRKIIILFEEIPTLQEFAERIDFSRFVGHITFIGCSALTKLETI